MSGAWPPWARLGGRTAARRPASSGTSTAIRAWRWDPAPAGGQGNPPYRREGPAVAEKTIDLDGPRHGPAAGRQPRALVVFLHGLGADGHDLISLAPMLAPLLPDTAFVSPHAPYAFDIAPMGRQWFSFADRHPHQNGKRSCREKRWQY